MKTFKTEGIILKRRNTGEADRVLTIFSKQYGKIYVVAKGVRRITSRRGGNVEIFTHTSIFIIETRTTQILTEAETISSFSEIRKNLSPIGYAYTICELVDKLTAEKQENEQVYFLLLHSLEELNKKSKPGSQIVDDFEKEIIRILGFWPRNKSLEGIDVEKYIEGIIEKELKSKKFMQKLT